MNLGLGFYGRSYTLADENCWQPGCVFEGVGHAGTCSVSISGMEQHEEDAVTLTTLSMHQGTAGYMSHQDIEYHLQNETGTVHYDKESAVQYLTFAFCPC